MDLFLTILLASGILILGFGIMYLISYLLRRYDLFGHTAQFFLSIWCFIVIVLFTYVAFGESTVRYLMSGLFLGIGLALQPLMKTVTKGFVFDGTRLSRVKGDIELVGRGVRGHIHTVGLIHTWIVDKDHNYYMISNDLFQTDIVKVYTNAKSRVGKSDDGTDYRF